MRTDSWIYFVSVLYANLCFAFVAREKRNCIGAYTVTTGNVFVTVFSVGIDGEKCDECATKLN